MTRHHVARWGLFAAIIALLCVPFIMSAQDIHTESVLTAGRVAPGESMPIRVRLTNFGTVSRTDVAITYQILDEEGRRVSEESETVAVETTASFIRNLTIPHTAASGTYTARVIVSYPGQETPAESSYQFNVEKKIAGVFLSDFLKYAFIAIAATATAGIVFQYFHRSHTAGHHDYSSIPASARIYYEMIGEMVHEMRLHEGDNALVLVQHIPGLRVSEMGRIESLEGNPADIVARIVKEYEKKFGKRANFALGKSAQRRLVTHVS